MTTAPLWTSVAHPTDWMLSPMTLLSNVPGAASAEAQRRVAAQAVGATKTYGKGDGAVVALDRVDVEFAGAFTAIHRSSGSGSSCHETLRGAAHSSGSRSMRARARTRSALIVLAASSNGPPSTKQQ